MKTKIIFELDFILKTSPKVLNSMLFTPEGLAEWFSDSVKVKDDIYTFEWDGYIEEARLLPNKSSNTIKWRWLEDEENDLDTYFGFSYTIDPVTNAVVLTICGFSENEEMEEAKALWEQHVSDLRRVIGA
jgi:hypothetical protein